ncbi:MAG: hypothetical protein PHE79_07885 [Eubacteriales bacterium]|nr:hypothetical protein [Eubacteriales bacterium]
MNKYLPLKSTQKLKVKKLFRRIHWMLFKVPTKKEYLELMEALTEESIADD